MVFATPPSASTTTHKRIGVVILLAVATLLNYLDRTLLGIAAPAITRDLSLSPAILGILFSAFSWTYTLAQVPSGILLDRIGNRVIYSLALALWSLFTALHGFTTNFATMVLCRMGLGVAQAPCFPGNSRVISIWFPQQERARATATFTVAEYLGIACFSPLLFWILNNFGWRSLFIAVGSVGLLVAPVWWGIYRDPSKARKVSHSELAHISFGGGLEASGASAIPFSWATIVWLFKKRQIFGSIMGKFAGNTTLVFFLTWFPTYLEHERQMGWLKVGIFTAIPFIAAAVGSAFGGLISDCILEKTGSANLARKLPIISGLVLASLIIGANYVASDEGVVFFMSMAFFGQGMASLGWTLTSDIAPKQLLGLTGGLSNFFTNLAGIITPLIIGFLLSASGSYFYAFAYIAAVSVLGIVSYIFIVGDVKRIEFDVTTIK